MLVTYVPFVLLLFCGRGESRPQPAASSARHKAAYSAPLLRRKSDFRPRAPSGTTHATGGGGDARWQAGAARGRASPRHDTKPAHCPPTSTSTRRRWSRSAGGRGAGNSPPTPKESDVWGGRRPHTG